MESDSVIYGLLGRIHVMMRRVLNRITDVEYMRINKDYSREIVRIGEAAGHAELSELCARLRAAMELDATPATTDFQTKAGQSGIFQKLLHPEIHHEEAKDRYVRSLR